jgi:uncharacterized protein DUF3365
VKSCRSRLFAIGSVVSLLATAVLLADAPFTVVPAEEASADLQPAIARAQTAARLLQTALQNRLVEVLPKAGPAKAANVCRQEAYAIAADIGMQQGLSMGRTSHKLRNPNNAPRPWAAAIVSGQAQTKYAGAKTYAADLGSQVGVLVPIGMGEACSLCHGTKSWIPGEVAALLKQSYPQDQATGFATGDIRGWVWAEVPKQ